MKWNCFWLLLAWVMHSKPSEKNMAISHSSLWSECVFNLNQNSIIFMWISHPSHTNDNKWWWWLWMDGWLSPRCCCCRKNCLGNVYNSKWIFIIFETAAPCLVYSFFSFTGAKSEASLAISIWTRCPGIGVLKTVQFVVLSMVCTPWNVLRNGRQNPENTQLFWAWKA